jgi:hypothetical protein
MHAGAHVQHAQRIAQMHARGINRRKRFIINPRVITYERKKFDELGNAAPSSIAH